MVHLMTAYEYRPNSPAEFWVGNLAPDCIEDWQERDTFHLRNVADKEQAFDDFAKTISSDNLFSEGMLLHLFVDWKWDGDLRQQYIKNFHADDWFQSYRNEIGLLSARLYHDTFWSVKIWDEMLNCDIAEYNKTKNIPSENTLSILNRANKYHIENPSVEPCFYAVETIIDFTKKTAKDYRQWRNITV
jgi:hypothetical protein